MPHRPRKDGESVQEWLLTEEQRNETSRFNLKGALAIPFTAPWVQLENSPYDARQPPLITTPLNWLNKTVGANFTCQVPVLKINAPKELVWREILDFDHYHEWNPFHRQVQVVEDENKLRSVQMWVNFNPKDESDLIPVEKASKLSTERLLYVDEREQCNIIAYGLDWYFIPTLRVQVVEADGPNSCIYYSYDHFGGWAATLILRFTMQANLTKCFTLAAECLKRRCEARHTSSSSPARL